MKKAKVEQHKITINDVARLSGVSKTTVSRFINGRQDLMSQAVSDRIQEVIEELNFRPSRIAQNLKFKRTSIIGCVIADIASDFSANLVEGVSEIFSKNECQVLLINSGNNPQKEKDGIQSLLDSKVDGLIVNTTGNNEDFLKSVRESGIPIVIADRYLEDVEAIDTITSTNYQSTVECIDFLKEQGYDHVYFFGQSFGNNKIRVIRHEAFLDAKETNFPEDVGAYTYFITNEKPTEQIKTALHQIREKHRDENVALFAVNGMMTLDLIGAIKELDLTIGDDFGLCGFDDWKWASLIEPGITTIRQDTYALGSQSAHRLLELIQNDGVPKAKLVELPTKLIIRGSTSLKKG